MVGVLATYRHGKIDLASPVGWPDGTKVEVVPVRIGPDPVANGNKAESYREFIERLAGSFGDEPFERPEQGEFERREEW